MIEKVETTDRGFTFQLRVIMQKQMAAWNW